MKRSPACATPLMHWAESFHDPDQFFLSGFLCPDPFLVVEHPGKPVLLAVNPMEFARAQKEARPLTGGGARVAVFDRLGKGKGMAAAVREAAAGAREVRVLPSLPVGVADLLRGAGIALVVDPLGTLPRRRKKTAGQVAAIASVQGRLEGAFDLVRALLGAARTRRGALELRGLPLTAEALRREIEGFLLTRGCECAETIVAPGRRSSDPHWAGEGPIRAGVPIVVDIFPRDRVSRFHSDMTRTFVKGKASPEVAAMHRAVCAAQDAAFSRLKPGVLLPKVHEAVSREFTRRGFPAGSEKDRGKVLKRGFLHSTGHGVGLAIHEAPSVGFSRPQEFSPGDVVTVEPGLYDPRLGGVRIEDIVAFHPDGAVRRLTDFPRELEIP